MDIPYGLMGQAGARPTLESVSVVYYMVKNFGSKKVWRITQSFFANFPVFVI